MSNSIRDSPLGAGVNSWGYALAVDPAATLTMPLTAGPDTYILLAVADARRSVIESDEANNVTCWRWRTATWPSPS